METELTQSRKMFWTGLGAWDSEGAWIAHVQPGSIVWLQWSSSSGQNVLKCLLADGHEALENETAVITIPWHEKSEMGKPEPEGYPTPVR